MIKIPDTEPTEPIVRFQIRLSNGVELQGRMPESLYRLGMLRKPDDLTQGASPVGPNDPVAIVLPPGMLDFYHVD